MRCRSFSQSSRRRLKHFQILSTFFKMKLSIDVNEDEKPSKQEIQQAYKYIYGAKLSDEEEMPWSKEWALTKTLR